MNNIWLTLSKQPHYILPADANDISKFNLSAKPEHRLQTQFFPEPYLGNVLNAKVILLNLNPGVDQANTEIHNKEPYLNRAWNNLHHLDQPFPFFLLDPALKGIPGNVWWNKKLKSLIKDTSLERVAKAVACVEIHGYPSENYKHFPKLPSMAYTKHLVEEGIKRDALFIMMRGERYWQSLLPQLMTYPNKTHIKNARNPCISRNNLSNPDSYINLLDLL